MSENVGEIVYIIRADTAQLLNAGRNVVDMTNDLQNNFDDTDESAGNLNTTLSKLAATLKLIFAAGALREMAKMVQSYQEMAERVQMATSSQTEFESVQKRLLNTANGTYRSLAEAQELYIRSADGLRSMGYSTEQAIDVQDSMSYAFVKNAASADRAESAISAFTKAINTGKVSADQWESITTAIPTVINDIASASGKTAAEIRALGAAGKLTASELSEGLRQSLDENAAAAAGMSNNLTDASVRIKTAITEVLVAIEHQTGALQSFTNDLISASDAVLEFGRDSESMSGFIDNATVALQALALVMAGRYAGALTTAASAQIKSTTTKIADDKAAATAAQAAEAEAGAKLRSAQASKSAAVSDLNLAQTRLNTLKATNASSIEEVRLANAEAQTIRTQLAQIQSEKALETQRLRAQITDQGRIQTATRMAQLQQASAVLTTRLAATEAAASQARATAIAAAEAKVSASRLALADVTGVATAADGRFRASQEATAIATRAASTSMGLLRGAFALIGGTAGVIMIAAGALFYWWQTTKQAKEEAINFASSLDDVISRMKEMDQIQLRKTLDDAAKSVESLNEQFKDQVKEQNNARKNLEEYQRQLEGLRESGAPLQVIEDAQRRVTQSLRELNAKTADINDTSNTLRSTLEKQALIQEQLNQKARDSDAAFAVLENNLKNVLPGAADKAITVMAATIEFMDKLNKKAANVGNVQSAEQEMSPEAKKLIQNAKRRLELSKKEGEARAKLQAEYDAEDAGIEKGNKLVGTLQDMYAETERVTSARKAANKEAKKSADDATQFLSRQQSALDRLNTGYADGSLELAKYDAVMALGNKATDAQIVKAEQQADAIWRSQQAIKAAAEEEKKRTQASQNFTSLQGQVSPVAAVDNSYLTQMAQLDEYVTLYPQKIAEAEALRASIEEQYHQRRMAAMWEEWQQQSQINSMIGAAVDSLQGGATSAITGLINGTQSLRESFANIGTTILNSVVGSFVQMGIEWAKSQLMGQAAAAASLAATTAQASAAAAAWAPAAMSASIATYGSAAAVGQSAYAGSMLMAKGMALAGGRRYGGTVSAGNAYRINEDGRSEVFQTTGGQQIFMPNKSGKIIPADKAGGGGVVQHITFEINTTGGIDQATMKQMEGMMKRVALFQINDQANRPNGMIQPRNKR
ncbi:tape measure protein [Atlantibacter subterraneus]|uniref:tape measure protein n=1 Tax=Atlantibacter subterraneus TaxID=255519 RepID=UPI00289702F4|nr:tape measure protein [Atlantibacter subterranea]